MNLPDSVQADIELTCPRCEAVVVERFYGPCDNCRAELRATQQKEQSDLAETEFEPKMNVTPNAVALKE